METDTNGHFAVCDKTVDVYEEELRYRLARPTWRYLYRTGSVSGTFADRTEEMDQEFRMLVDVLTSKMVGPQEDEDHGAEEECSRT